MKIYTKQGDEGKTSLLGGQYKSVSKTDERLEAFGTLDELNSWLGLIADSWKSNQQIQSMILDIQHQLFNIGTHLALDEMQKIEFTLPQLPDISLHQLENEIDRMTEELPPLKHFILPGGHQEVSHIHIARSVCRRTERATAKLVLPKEKAEKILPYLNRLSDYLFTLARYKAQEKKVDEVKWQPS